MGNRINIAELLKDCPKGMELDCTLFDDVVFERIETKFLNRSIVLRRLKSNIDFAVNKHGQIVNSEDSKCIIFPKGKTTWEGFVPPRKYQNGDIVITTLGSTAIIEGPVGNTEYYAHCVWVCGKLITDDTIGAIRFATESEKAELFKAIKESGFKWNEETKTLEKLSQYPQTFEECCEMKEKIIFEFGAMSSRFRLQAENKFTAYAAMVLHFYSDPHLVALYEPEDLAKQDSWLMHTPVEPRLDEIFGGNGSFMKYLREHDKEIKEAFQNVEKII